MNAAVGINTESIQHQTMLYESKLGGVPPQHRALACCFKCSPQAKVPAQELTARVTYQAKLIDCVRLLR